MKLLERLIGISIGLGIATYTSAQVGIGTTLVDPAALLQLESNNRVLLLPRVDLALVSGPSNGLLTYSTDRQRLVYYSAGSWRNVVEPQATTGDGISVVINATGATASIGLNVNGVPLNKLSSSTGLGPGAAPNTTATDGQVLVYNAANGRWQPGTAGGSSQWLNDPPNDIYYAAGNVGIGFNNPIFPLHVTASGPNGTELTTMLVATENINAGAGPVIQFRNNPTGGSGYLASIAAVDDGGGDGRLEFRTSNDDIATAAPLTNTSTRMTISQLGNVAIGGTPSALTRLRVVDQDDAVNTPTVQFTNLAGTAGVSFSDNQISPFSTPTLILRPANTGVVNTYRQDLLVDPSNDVQFVQRIQRESTNNNPQTGYGIGTEYWLEVAGNTLVNTASISSVLTNATTTYQSALDFATGESSTGLQTRLRLNDKGLEFRGSATTLQAQDPATGAGSNLNLRAGNGALAGNGGDVIIYGGGTGSGAVGDVILAHTGGLPRGNVGIGTNNPNSLLHVVSNTVGGVGFLTQIHAFSATSGTGLSVNGGFTTAGSFQTAITNGTGVLASGSGTGGVGIRAQGNSASAFLTGDVIFENTGADGVIRGQSLPSGPADNLRIEAGNSVDDQGGNLTLAAGNSPTGGLNGGNVFIRAGEGDGDGGYVIIEGGVANNNSGGDVFITGGPQAMGDGTVRIGFKRDAGGNFIQPSLWQLGINGTVNQKLSSFNNQAVAVPTLGANGLGTIDVPVPGAEPNDAVWAIFNSNPMPGLIIISARVNVANQVRIVVLNASGGGLAGNTYSANILLIR